MDMKDARELLDELNKGVYDKTFSKLYVLDGVETARARACAAVQGFLAHFPASSAGKASLFSAPGRTEIGGNHTDHQHGHVLCASVDLDVLACAAPNETDTVNIISEGYPALKVLLNSLLPQEKERSTSAALVRGVTAKVRELGYAVGGFDAYILSSVPSGSGLSSSAAYEVLLGNIINCFFCGGRLDAVTLAKIGQYAENVYFGKPCGLMDQMGSSVGGCVAIDFADPADPVVERVACDFSGYTLCIVDTGSCHDDLTEDYAEITREMGAVAAYFGKSVLRDVPKAQFRAAIPALRAQCGDRAVLRAMHFYADDRRAGQEAEALRRGDFAGFLSLVNASGLSSETMLQNAWPVSNPRQQAIPLALALGRELLEGEGAIRVHGGGFAGTVQAFVPNEKRAAFKSGMEAVLGQGSCHILHIRPQGGCVITP